jgi:hypothetical protein
MPVDFPIVPTDVPRSPEAFRRQVRNVLDSYHATDLDVLSEIIQNSVDAIEEKFATYAGKDRPTIVLDVDTKQGKISISDSGTGISDGPLSTLSVPEESTDKDARAEGAARKRGHKGVGLAFAIWSSASFRFATKRHGEARPTSGELKGGAIWAETSKGACPVIEEARTFDPAFLTKVESGTVLEFVLGADYPLIKLLGRLKEGGIEILLRTATAVGVCDIHSRLGEVHPAWLKATRFLLRENDGAARDIQLSYFYPEDEFGKKAFDIGQLSDLSIEKQAKLMGTKKCIFATVDTEEILKWLQGEEKEDSRKLAESQRVVAYGAFFDRAATINTWNASLFKTGAGRGRYRQIVSEGIHFVTSTMPCGEVIDIDLTYGTGNKNRLYVVVQFDNARPDIGRKTFAKPLVYLAQDIARQLAVRFVQNRKLLEEYGNEDLDQPEGELELTLESVKDRVKAKPDLSLQDTGVVKAPLSEQDVIALFHALLGSGYVKGFQVYGLFGSNEPYDGVFAYRIGKTPGNLFPRDPVGLALESFPPEKDALAFPLSIMEFKLNLSDLVDDFQNGYKRYDDIRVAVCWETGDEGAFEAPSEYRLTEVAGDNRERQFSGETHLLTAPGRARAIHVLMLSRVVERLAQAKGMADPRA